MELISAGTNEAKSYGGTAFKKLVESKYGMRFQPERVPSNPIVSKLEQSFLNGEVESAKKVLAFIEADASLTRNDILATMHLYIMSTNNELHKKFGQGKRIDDVAYFTDKYLTEQSANFH